MELLVGGESKLGSTEHDPVDDGDMTKFQLHSHVQSIMSTTTNGLPTHWCNIGDTHTEGSNGIYGLTREACWAVDRIPPRLAGSVKESHIHLPEPNVDVCVSLFSASVYPLM
jgi:hypothetical protein